MKASGKAHAPSSTTEERFDKLYHENIAQMRDTRGDHHSITAQFDQIHTSIVKPAQNIRQKARTTGTPSRKSISHAEAPQKESRLQNEREEPTNNQRGDPTNSSDYDPSTSSTGSSSLENKTATKAAVNQNKPSGDNNAPSRNPMNSNFQFSDEEEDF